MVSITFAICSILSTRKPEMSFGIGSTEVSFTSLDARLRKSATTAQFEAQWQYSFDNFVTAGVPVGQYSVNDVTTAGNGGAAPTIDLSLFSGLQDITNETITFRLYVWGTPASSATSFALGRSSSDGDDFLGNAVQFGVIPEPGAMSIGAGLIVLAFCMTKRYRIKG